MPGICVRSISQRLGPTRVLKVAIHHLSSSSVRPQASLSIAREPLSSSCNNPVRRQYHIRNLSSMSSAEDQPETAATAKPELPPLSRYQEKEFSRLAVRMNVYV